VPKMDASFVWEPMFPEKTVAIEKLADSVEQKSACRPVSI